MLIPNFAIKTDFGLTKGINNDNSLVYSRSTKDGVGTLLIVVHGVGAFGYGEKSSRLVLDAIYQEIEAVIEQLPHDFLQDLETFLKKSLRKSVEKSDEVLNDYFKDDDRKGGAAVVCAFVWGNSMVIANVGDNRAYLFRASKLQQLTEDHTLATLMAKQGHEKQPKNWKFVLHNLLGSNNQIQIDLFTLTLEAKDQLLLCSNGLNRQLDDTDIAEILSRNISPEQMVDQLISTANDKGGLYNTAAIVCEMIEGRPDFTSVLKGSEAKPHKPSLSSDEIQSRKEKVSASSDSNIATRSSWRTVIPMPEAKSQLQFELTFSQKEYDRLKRGLIPKEMEHKWFIFFEDDWLYCHRSWTGYCIYQVRLKSIDDEYKIVEAWVNREPEQYQATDNDHDVAMLKYIINVMLLGETEHFPIPKNIEPGLNQLLYWHHIGGQIPKDDD